MKECARQDWLGKGETLYPSAQSLPPKPLPPLKQNRIRFFTYTLRLISIVLTLSSTCVFNCKLNCGIKGFVFRQLILCQKEKGGEVGGEGNLGEFSPSPEIISWS